jgi:hypothetical protein
VALLLFVHILRGTTLTAQHSERVDRPERWNPPRRSKSMGRVASAPRRPHPVLPSPGDQAWILQIFILLCRFEHADHLLLGSGCRRTRGQSSLLACSEHYDKARGCGRLSSGGSGAAVGADDLATEAIFDPSSSTLGGQSVSCLPLFCTGPSRPDRSPSNGVSSQCACPGVPHGWMCCS